MSSLFQSLLSFSPKRVLIFSTSGSDDITRRWSCGIITVSEAGILTFPFLHTLEMTNLTSVREVISFMFFPNMAGLLIWNSLMNGLAGSGIVFCLTFFPSPIFRRIMMTNIIPITPTG